MVGINRICGMLPSVAMRGFWVSARPMASAVSSRLVNPATVVIKSTNVDFKKHGFSNIRHPQLKDMHYSIFAIPPHNDPDFTAEDYDQMLGSLRRVPFNELAQLDEDRERYTATTFNFDKMWMGWHQPNGKLHRYVVKRYPKSEWYMLSREIASVYCSVALGTGAHAVKTHAYLIGDNGYFLRRFIRGIDGLSVLANPDQYPNSFVSNDALANLYVAYRVIMSDADYNNPRNIVMAHNSKVVGDMAGGTAGEPTVVMIDGEGNFPSDELFTQRMVKTMGLSWTPGMPYDGSVEWRHAMVSALGRDKFIRRSMELEDPLLRLLAHRLTPEGAPNLVLQRTGLVHMVKALEDNLRYLGYFKVQSLSELNDPKLPIRFPTQHLYNALKSEKPITLGDAITGFFN
jgi:hypothetical protein